MIHQYALKSKPLHVTNVSVVLSSSLVLSPLILHLLSRLIPRLQFETSLLPTNHKLHLSSKIEITEKFFFFFFFHFWVFAVAEKYLRRIPSHTHSPKIKGYSIGTQGGSTVVVHKNYPWLFTITNRITECMHRWLIHRTF